MVQSDVWEKLLIACLILGALFVMRPSIHGNDGVQNYAYLHSLLFDGDLDFTNEYSYYYAKEASWFDNKLIPRDSTTGKPINLYGIGNSLLWLPWVLGFHVGGKLANSLGANVTLDGYSRLYEYAVGIGSVFYASLGLLLLYRFLRRSFSPPAAFWAVLAVWLCTPLFFYMYLHPSMSHANSFFLSTCVACVYWKKRHSLLLWAGLGFLAGLMILTRFQDGVLLVAIAAVEFSRVREVIQRPRLRRVAAAYLARRVVRWGCFCVALVVLLFLQMIAWRELHGSFFSGPRGYLSQGRVTLYYPRHFISGLFSSFHGLFHWHPILLIGLCGFFSAPLSRRKRLFGLAGFIGQAWIVGSWSIWWAGASFGQRMFISTLPHLGLGFGAIFKKYERRQVMAAFLIGIGMFWNFGLIVQYAARIIPRQAPVNIVTLARNNVTKVPLLLLRGPSSISKAPQQSE